MKYPVSLPVILLGLALFTSGTLADADKPSDSIKNVIQKSLQRARPDFVVQQIEKTDIAGLYAVYLANGLILYSTANGSYVVEGNVYRVEDKQLVDVREEKMKPLRVKILAGVPKSEMIIFSPEGPVKSAISVFTDVDCPYCQKLHNNMAEYNKRGIEVRYLAFPRAGPNSISAKKLASAWCADDPRDSITKLTQRQPIPEKTCENPVSAQYMLGEKIGVNGTPAVYAPDGSLIGGYLDPDQMAKALGIM